MLQGRIRALTFSPGSRKVGEDGGQRPVLDEVGNAAFKRHTVRYVQDYLVRDCFAK